MKFRLVQFPLLIVPTSAYPPWRRRLLIKLSRLRLSFSCLIAVGLRFGLMCQMLRGRWSSTQGVVRRIRSNSRPFSASISRCRCRRFCINLRFVFALRPAIPPPGTLALNFAPLVASIVD